MADPVSPAVLAEDLRALAEWLSDRGTPAMLVQAAELLDEMGPALAETAHDHGPSPAPGPPRACACGQPGRGGEHSEVLCRRITTGAELLAQPSTTASLAPLLTPPSDDAALGEPVSLDTLVWRTEMALEVAAIEVRVVEDDGRTSPLRRLVRCLRSADLLDEGDAVSVAALRALAGGQPVDEVAEDHGCDPGLLALVAPWVRPGARDHPPDPERASPPRGVPDVPDDPLVEQHRDQVAPTPGPGRG